MKLTTLMALLYGVLGMVAVMADSHPVVSWGAIICSNLWIIKGRPNG